MFRVRVVYVGVYRCVGSYWLYICVGVLVGVCMDVFLFLFLFLARFFVKNRNSVISVNSLKMCPTLYCRHGFCIKITGTRRLCLSIPCTCFQIVFINYLDNSLNTSSRFGNTHVFRYNSSLSLI